MAETLALFLTPDWAKGENQNGERRLVFEAPVFDPDMRAWKCCFRADGERIERVYGQTALQSFSLATRLASKLYEEMD